ncbi:autotransporter domain-containing protein [Pseudoxanthomonas gei]|uniref:Autotransporter domain-containing protein n=1 Tax=Pseudoxanthomonas gei TaxID=1383030 RepID=A0ABX0A7V1_9GAMM|nr:autotransporter serine protease [Pseudoxanthomonas gei]NDK37566.1 autotransporter domain-containing protein [Pseudoxanthomonas gei]
MRSKQIDKVACACMLALALVACGGGGGGSTVRVNPPPAAPPPVPPTPPVVEAPNPAYGKHLLLTNTAAAHAAGFTGQGVTIGVVDSGINRNHPALAGRVIANLNYISSPPNNLSIDDVDGHGTAVSQIIAGKPFGAWPGGIAPGANLVSARIISDKPPVDDGSGQGNEVNGALGLASVHRDLINRGARIMNNSWGGLYWTNPAATAPIASEYRDFIFANDGLVVFATGNETRPNPSDMAALPSQPGTGGGFPAADLERGWLAVAALDTDNPTQLASYSNACGLAMRYCLAAPGKVVVTGTNDAPASPTYWSWSGTSLAAPQVSGAAALVWQAFPYFNNDLVRQTLLGTATDLGAPGVDAVFGQGALNVGRAVLGPARFDWGDVTANFSGGTSTWGNAISGAGGLVKQGTGTLVLASSSTYSGPTQVLGGELRISDNNTLASKVSVGPAGTLSGYARVAELRNNGTLRLDQPAFNVTGDYYQGSQARMAVLLSSPLYVGGTAYLDGELHVLGTKPGYVATGSENILAANAIVGRFASLTAAPTVFLDGSLAYTATHVWLNITRLNVAAAAMAMGNISSVSLGSAQRVEDAFGLIDAQPREGGGISADFIAAAGRFQAATSQAQALASLQSLSGELHAVADAMTYDAVGLNRRALSTHFSGQPQAAPRGAWYQALGGPGSGSYAGSSFDTAGWMLGQEARWGRQGVAGFAFGETQVRGRRGAGLDNSRDRQTHAQFYLGATQGSAYALGQLGFGRYDRHTERSLLLGERYRGTATAYSGNFSSASVEAGYHLFDPATADVTAYLGAEHTQVDRNGFSEGGVDGFGLATRDSRGQRTQGLAGIRAERAWRLADGRQLTLRGYGEWQQFLAGQGLVFDASFVGVPSWSPLLGADARDSSGLLGLGLDLQLLRHGRLSLGYDQRVGATSPARAVALELAYGF